MTPDFSKVSLEEFEQAVWLVDKIKGRFSRVNDKVEVLARAKGVDDKVMRLTIAAECLLLAAHACNDVLEEQNFTALATQAFTMAADNHHEPQQTNR